MRWSEFSGQRADNQRPSTGRGDEGLVVDTRSRRRPSEFVDQKLTTLLREQGHEAGVRPAVRR